MNFYEHQDRARRRTAHLLVYFALAVGVIVAAINAVVFIASRGQSGAPPDWHAWLTSTYGVWTSGAVLGVIGAGSAYTSLRLAGGGKALAGMVGARPLHGTAGSSAERQLRNVVEEMAIASGTPVPALYVLDDEATINAFVAGTRPTETVLVVTRGALDAFTRHELQGVVAHEYSHIFHEDMRINMRLMGILAGILLISRMGRSLMRAGGSSSEKSAGQAALLGLALFIIGYLGVVLGALIQAAVSRQREFLADASAVQFTRNPNGIAAALYRIGHGGESRLRSAHAGDLAHFCFAETVRPTLAGLFASHPPLEARIAAIAPGFTTAHTAASPRAVSNRAPKAQQTSGPSSTAGLVAAGVAASVGKFASAARVSALQAELPAALADAARGPAPAALIYALLLAVSPAEAHSAALTVIAEHEGEAVMRAVLALLPAFAGVTAGVRLPLLNLVLPQLQALAVEVRMRICRTVAAMIEADGELSFFEFTTQRILEDHLAPRAGRAVAVRHFRFKVVAGPLRVVFACLAWAGSDDVERAQRSFRRAYLPFAVGEAELPARQAMTARLLVSALGELAALAPLLKRNVIGACADCVIEDGQVMPAEAELLQAIALSLDCPLPPLATTAAPS